MAIESEGHLDPLRVIARTENPFPNLTEIEQAYAEFKPRLPNSDFLDAPVLDPDCIADNDLLVFDSTSATVTPYADTTDPSKLFPYLALGQPAFELPPKISGLNLIYPTSLIRSDRIWTDTRLRERLEEIASQTMANPARAKEYVRDELPLATAWSTMAVIDAIERFNELTGGQILGSNGRIIDEIAERTIIINGDNGGGVASVSNLAHRGVVFQENLPDSLSPAQTGFAAASIGVENSLTVAAACAGFNNALHAAEMYASSDKSGIDLVVVFAAFDGPTSLTQLGFDVLGLPPSQALPYIGEEGIGYVETPGAAAMVLPTKKLAEQLGLSRYPAYLTRTISNQGKSKMGVERQRDISKGVPGTTYEKAFILLNQYYPEGFPGNVLTLTHGTKTLGATLEKGMLPQMRERHGIGRITVTSTQPLLGHQYSPRGGFSLANGIVANAEGIAWGMAPANRDLSLFGEEGRLQDIRRSNLQRVTQIQIPLVPIDYKNERAAEKSVRDLEELRDSGVDILLATKRIPNSAILATHQGLGGHSDGILLMRCNLTQ